MKLVWSKYNSTVPILVVLNTAVTTFVVAYLFASRRSTAAVGNLLQHQPGQLSGALLHLQQPEVGGLKAVPYNSSSWEPLLLPEELTRGFSYQGTGSRVASVASSLLNGKPITAVVIGGSVAFGVGATNEETSFAGRFFEFLNTTFPHSDHVLLNRAIPSTASSLFAICSKQLVPEDADLVIIEFTFNEPGTQPFTSPSRKFFELLIRRLLKLPKSPGIILLHYYGWWLAGGDGKHGGLFYNTAETQLNALAQFYDLPTVSMRNALWNRMVANQPPFTVSSIVLAGHAWGGGPIPGVCEHSDLECISKMSKVHLYGDFIHPTDTGHQVMADLLIMVMQKALKDVSATALSPLLAHSLPAPMVPDNLDQPTNLCAIKEAIHPFVLDRNGFEYRPERPNATNVMQQKWGWTGTETGAFITLEVDTNNTASDQTDFTYIYLGYLRSYEGMGVAIVECTCGCTCEPTYMDGLWQERSSQTQMHMLEVTQDSACQVRISIIPRDSPGLPSTVTPGQSGDPGNKIQLSVVIVAQNSITVQTTVLQGGLAADAITQG